MNALTNKAIGQISKSMLILAVALFAPAGSLHYWQAWMYWLVFSASCVRVTTYLLKHDPGLVVRRLKAGPAAEKEKSQKIIQTFTSVAFILLIIFPGLDHHFGWFKAAPLVSLLADVVVAAGFYIVFLALRENTFASSIIETARGQKVISTGVYAFVRHPMYSGVVLLIVATPLALGSVWGLLFIVPAIAGIVWRLLDEERFLLRNLQGYPAYYRKTRSRLVPSIW